MARIDLCITDRPVKIDCILDKPTNDFYTLRAQRRVERWDNFFADYPMPGYNYSHVIYIKRANLIPMTEFKGEQIVSTILPFFHSAVLCLDRGELSRVLLVRHTAMLNYLLSHQPPKLPEYAYEETLSVGNPPEMEPRRFDAALGQIGPFGQYRVMIAPKWQSERLQSEAHEFQAKVARLQLENGGKKGYSSKIVYTLRSPQLHLKVPFESFMVYPQQRVIYLVQHDRLAGD